MTNEEKIRQAFGTLHTSGDFSVEVNRVDERRKIKFIPHAALACAVVLLCGTVAVAAGIFFRWNHGLEESMHVGEDVKEDIEASGLVDRPVDILTPAEEDIIPTVTEHGITIAADQTLVDNYYAVIAFKVEGFDPGDDVEPSFDSVGVMLDDKDVAISSGSFYNGLLNDGYGYAVNEEGIRYEEGSGVKEVFRQEDGSYTYILNVYGGGSRGDMLGKMISVHFKDIGIAPGKAEHETYISGDWELKWRLSGTSDAKLVELSEPLGESGAVVKELEVSPISIRAVCSWPRRWVEEKGTDENGAVIVSSFLAEPPMLTGVKLKDGTLLPFIFDGGSSGYVQEDGDDYEQRYAVDRILNVDEVEAMLFLKTPPSGGERASEENFYVIPLGE